MKVNFNRLTDLYKNKKIDISECLSKVKFEYRHLSPAIYLYNKIISYNGNKFSKDFIELLYVTLDAWNMNSRAANLSEFDDFKKSILDNKNLFKKLENLNIRNIEEAFDTLKDLYNNLNLVGTNSPLVTFTKTLHFMLPELVVPIDRKYTLSFFGVNNYQLVNNPYEVFEGIHKGFCDFANAVAATEKGLSSYLENNTDNLTWLTSEAKIIDNIIIGYQKSRTKKGS